MFVRSKTFGLVLLELLGGKFPKTSKELIPILKKFDINLCSGWYGAMLLKRSVKEEMEHIRNQLNLFQTIVMLHALCLLKLPTLYRQTKQNPCQKDRS